jgi:hypothetical protein
VRDNPINWYDPFGLDCTGKPPGTPVPPSGPPGNGSPNPDFDIKPILDIISTEIQDIIAWLYKWDLPGMPGPGTNTAVCILQNGPSIYKAAGQVAQNNQNITQTYQLVCEVPTETPCPLTTQK